MNVDPRQYDPESQDPNATDSERQSQFGMQSQADMPLTSGTTGTDPAGAPAWGQRDVVASAPVYGSDDKKIGTVQESYRDSFKVKSGFLFTHDYYFPYSVIARSDPERIVLNLTSDQAKHENWQQQPQTDTTAGPAATAQQQPVYGIYGPEGPQDTIQSATERGADTAIPMGPATPADPTQGDMLYRGTVGPNNEPGLAGRPYNPGLQGTGTPGQENDEGRIGPEHDPTSWSPDQQPPIPGV